MHHPHASPGVVGEGASGTKLALSPREPAHDVARGNGGVALTTSKHPPALGLVLPPRLDAGPVERYENKGDELELAIEGSPKPCGRLSASMSGGKPCFRRSAATRSNWFGASGGDGAVASTWGDSAAMPRPRERKLLWVGCFACANIPPPTPSKPLVCVVHETEERAGDEARACAHLPAKLSPKPSATPRRG